MFNIKKITTALLLSAVAMSASAETSQKEEKNPEDPTKIITRAGVAYVDAWTVTGSIGLDQTKMLNARISEDANEWRVGGSWLFDIGIVNVNFSRSDYDNDSYKNNYSIGTFMPLSVFGIEPLGIQIFPMAGYSYNDGEFAQDNTETAEINDYVMEARTSHGVYAGAFAMKPLANNLTAMAFGGGNYGSDDYSGYWFGAGLSYMVNDHHSVRTFAMKSDDDFGSEEKIGFAYTYEFE